MTEDGECLRCDGSGCATCEAAHARESRLRRDEAMERADLERERE